MKKLSITLIAFLISTITFACSCDLGGNFIRVSKYAELTVKAKVITREFHTEDGKKFNSLKKLLLETDNKDYSESIIIEVTERINGTDKRNRIEIYGSNGADCLIGVHHFEIGKTYVFSLITYKYIYTDEVLNLESIYSIEGCSENWLEYFPETNRVKGLIKRRNNGKIRFYDYGKLVQKITKHNNGNRCTTP